MENKLSKWICRRLCAYQVIDKEYEDVYVYGFELIFSFLISTSIILTIGIVLKQVIPTLTFLITFILIRQFTGGYHANSYLKCKICTITCYALSVFLAHAVPIPTCSFIVLLSIGCLVICLFGPIENIHKPLTSEEKKKHKVTGLSLFIIWILIGFSVSFIMPIISNTAFYTLCMIIILMIIPLFERRTHHEETR